MSCCDSRANTGSQSPETSRGVAWVWLRIVLAVFVAGNSMTWALAINISAATPHERFILHASLLAATAVVVLLVGGRLLRDSINALFQLRLSIEFLFVAGCTGALGISVWSMIRGSGPVYFEVVSILLVIYCIGTELKSGAKQRALQAANALSPAMNYCEIVEEDGSTRRCLIESVRADDNVRCHPGEIIAVDGEILAGQALVREGAVTGETFVVAKRTGDKVFAGTDLIDSTIVVRAGGPGNQRVVDRVLRTIESARQNPTQIEQTAERYARWFLPIVVSVAVGTFVVWSSIGGIAVGLFNALSVLVVACPCAFGFATPVAVWSAITRLARRGLVLRRNDAVERLAQVDTIVFDKTGTLSEATSTLKGLLSLNGLSEDRLLLYAASLEAAVKHPVGEAFRDGVTRRLDVKKVETLSGTGVAGIIVEDSALHRVEVGTLEGLASSCCELRRAREAIAAFEDSNGDHLLAIRVDEELAGVAVVGEALLESNEAAFASLRSLGVRMIVLSGDSNPERLARLDIEDVRGAIGPEEKATEVTALREAGSKCLFVGDGLNDAAAMATAHVSVAVEAGSPLTAETADILWTNRDLMAIPDGLRVSRQTVRLLRSNLRFALCYNMLGMGVAAAGWLHPVFAALLMLSSSLFVTLRGARLAGQEEHVTCASRVTVCCGTRETSDTSLEGSRQRCQGQPSQFEHVQEFAK